QSPQLFPYTTLFRSLRAAMRLAAGEVGKNRHAREDRCVRKIGRLVSDLRDAQVRLQSLIQLKGKTAKHSGKNHFPHIEELLSLEDRKSTRLNSSHVS